MSDLSPTTYVQRTVYAVNNFSLGPSYKYGIRQEVYIGSSLPANVPVRIVLTNNSNYAKKISAQFEYLY